MLEPDGTEELRVGRDPVPRRLRRPGSVVLVAIAGLVVAWVTTRLGEQGDPSAGPTAAVSVTAVPTAAVPSAPTGLSIIPLPPGSTVAVVLEPTTLPTPSCPSGARCRTTEALPSAVAAALRAYYPGARILASRSVTGPVAGTTSLVGRSITAVAGARRFDIVVSPFVLGSDDFDRENSGATSTVRVRSATGDQTVQVILTEPRSARPNDLVVLRLARDQRLSTQ